MFESARNSRYVRFAETTCRWFEDCVEQHNATLLQNKRLSKRTLRCFVKHYGWKKYYTYRLSEDVWAAYNVLKALHQQKYCYSGVGSFQLNNKLTAFNTIKYFFSFTHRLNLTLQCSECDILSECDKPFKLLSL